MTWRDALDIFDLVTRALGALALIIVFLIGRTVVTRHAFAEWLKSFKKELDDQLKKMEDRLNHGDTAFEVLRTEEKHRPSRLDIDAFRRDLGMVNLSVAELTAGLRALEGRFAHTELQVDTLVRLQLGADR